MKSEHYMKISCMEISDLKHCQHSYALVGLFHMPSDAALGMLNNGITRNINEWLSIYNGQTITKDLITARHLNCKRYKMMQTLNM